MSLDSQQSPAARWLDHAVDIGLGATIFAAPMFMSGRHALGMFVFVALTSLTFVLWTVRQAYSRRGRLLLSGAEWIFLAAAAILAFQLVPLPEGLLAAISPKLSQLLPLRTAETSGQFALSSWNQISLDPYSTKAAIVLLVAYAMLFTVVVNRIRRLEDAERLLKAVGLAVAVCSVVALLQYFGTPHNAFRIYDIAAFTRTDGARGPFPNPNHFGHFVALGAGPLLLWTHHAWRSAGKSRSRNRSRRRDWMGQFVAPVCLAISFCAAMFTFSRATSLCLAGVVVVAAVICRWKGVWDRRATLAMAGCLAVAALGLTMHGQRWTQEMATLGDGIEGADNSHLRRTIWAADWRAVQDFPILGVGGGAHAEAYRAFMDRHLALEMTYSENSYLQIAVEAGFIGVAVLLAAILYGLFWAYRALCGEREKCERHWLVAAACIASLSATLAHATVDFIWYVPACVSFVLILLAVLYRVSVLNPSSDSTSQQPVSSTFHVSHRGWLVCAAASLVVAFVLINNRTSPLNAHPDWQAYLDLSYRANNFNSDDSFQLPDSVDPNKLENVDRMLDHLRRVVEVDPGFARAHVRIASLLERRFEIVQAEAENAMPLGQFRDAAYASGFSSKTAQDEWLTRAMGPNRELLDDALKHARLGLRNCPMYGEAYCSLSTLSFLDGQGPDKSRALVQQARRVRPHDGLVLLTAGVQAVRDGQLDDAQELLKTVFNQEPRFQREIIQLFGYTVAPQAMLSTFEPKYEGLKSLYRFYREHRVADGMQVVGEAYAAELEAIADTQRPDRAAKNLRYAHAVQVEIHRYDDAMRLISKAVDLAPNDVEVKRDYGRRLAHAGRFEDAMEALAWCAQRSQDPGIREELAQVNRMRLTPKHLLGAEPSSGSTRR